MVSLVVLAFAIPARYAFHLAGTWRWIYVVGAVIALHLDVFVGGIVQAFLKVPTLRTMAPTQSEPPFVFTQLVVMACFVLLAITAVGRFRGEQIQSARSVAFPARQSPGL